MIYLTTGLGVIGFFTCVFIAFYAVKSLFQFARAIIKASRNEE